MLMALCDNIASASLSSDGGFGVSCAMQHFLSKSARYDTASGLSGAAVQHRMYQLQFPNSSNYKSRVPCKQSAS